MRSSLSRFIRRLLHVGLAIILCTCIYLPMAPPAYSAPSKTTDEEIGSPWLDSPVPVDPSFGTTPLTTENGGINFRAILKSVGLNPDEIIQQLGYNPSRYWTAGMSIWSDVVAMLSCMRTLAHQPYELRREEISVLVILVF